MTNEEFNNLSTEQKLNKLFTNLHDFSLETEFKTKELYDSCNKNAHQVSRLTIYFGSNLNNANDILAQRITRLEKKLLWKSLLKNLLIISSILLCGFMVVNFLISIMSYC